MKTKIEKRIVPNEYNSEIVAKVKQGREDFMKGDSVTIKAENIWKNNN